MPGRGFLRVSQSLSGKPEGTKIEKSVTWIGKNSLFYGKWLKNIAKLDFGLSSKDKRPVSTRIFEALPITLTLNILSVIIVYIISIPLGIWSARQQNSVWDKVVMVKLFILYSLPEFWVATILLVFLAGGEYYNLFPLMGYVSDGAESFPFWKWFGNVAWHLFLPVTCYVYGSFAFLSRFSRANFLEVIRQDYIRTARSKGLSERVVVWKHAFRNSLIPLVTLMGTLIPGLLGGSVIIEQIFSIPGMGMLSFEAVLGRDQNVIMGIATIDAFLTLLSLLVSDLLYVWVDPRITFEGR
ncbi:MAG: ABC transporter permease [Deltaproteobacteria bacterium]|nr:ABC transporter permease [Deltaproteobacteria bacterium]